MKKLTRIVGSVAALALVPGLAYGASAAPETLSGAQLGQQPTSATGSHQGSESTPITAQRRTGRTPDLSRVVMTRMYQHDHWTIDAIRDRSPQDKITYLCDTLRPLKPTYVSGLVRLNGTEPITADQVTIFVGVKDCLPGTKFDVALNAEDYFDGGTNLPDRLQYINQNLQPNGWFFDFFTKPWKEGKAKNMQAGMRWMREQQMFVGGNTWGSNNIPDHADFISVTNLGGIGKAADLAKRIKREQPGMPVLMHIRNDPQIDHTEGLRWINATPERRKQLLQEHVAAVQQGMFDQYMFPVFFPLSCQRPTPNADRGCVGGGSTHSSYNAREDHLLRQICRYMGRPPQNCDKAGNQ